MDGKLSMIRRVKQFTPEALINDQEGFRDFVEKTESEILRGISTLVVLIIIDRHENTDPKGIYGYLLLRELEKETKNILIIEEGTLYPLLKKLEKANVVRADRKTVQGRTRKYYYITELGKSVKNHLAGFYSVLTNSMSSLFDFQVDIQTSNAIFCPNCANKISMDDLGAHFCEVCGYNIEALQSSKRTTNKGEDVI